MKSINDTWNLKIKHPQMKFKVSWYRFSWSFHGHEIFLLVAWFCALDFIWASSFEYFYHILNPVTSSHWYVIDGPSEFCHFLCMDMHILIQTEWLHSTLTIGFSCLSSPKSTSDMSSSDSKWERCNRKKFALRFFIF